MSFSVEELPVDDNCSALSPDSPPDQVYKIVVQWSNGTSTVIYRRYSMFFDIMVSQWKWILWSKLARRSLSLLLK